MGYFLYGVILVTLAYSGISPTDRFTWSLEIPWVALGLLACGVLRHRKVPITDMLKLALFCHALILIYGAYYTYELVPLGDWMKSTFGFTRNIKHYAPS